MPTIVAQELAEAGKYRTLTEHLNRFSAQKLNKDR